MYVNSEDAVTHLDPGQKVTLQKHAEYMWGNFTYNCTKCDFFDR